MLVGAIRQDQRRVRCHENFLTVAAMDIRQLPLVVLRHELPLALLASRHKAFLVLEVKACLAFLRNMIVFREAPLLIAIRQPHRFPWFSIAAFHVRPNRRKLSLCHPLLYKNT